MLSPEHPAAEVSIIPIGFHATAHSVFRNYIPPVFIPKESLRIRTAALDHPICCKDDYSDLCVSSNSECAICLDTFMCPVMLIECKHSFCSDCIVKWCSKSNICPLCKSCQTDFIQYRGSGINGAFHVWRLHDSSDRYNDDCLKADVQRAHRRTIKSAVRHYKRCFLNNKDFGR